MCSVGVPARWHVPDEEKAESVIKVLERANSDLTVVEDASHDLTCYKDLQAGCFSE
jgi:hypothetical protein